MSERFSHFSKKDIQITKKYLKKFLISLVIRIMQNKIPKRYHFSSVRMAIIKTWSEVLQDCEKKREGWCTVGGNVKQKNISILNNSIEVSQTIKNRNTMWSSHSTSGHTIYLKKMESGSWGYVCISMFISVFFTIDKIWNQSIFSKTNEWTRKKICILCISG